jgi:hypothetical protein
MKAIFAFSDGMRPTNVLVLETDDAKPKAKGAQDNNNKLYDEQDSKYKVLPRRDLLWLSPNLRDSSFPRCCLCPVFPLLSSPALLSSNLFQFIFESIPRY